MTFLKAIQRKLSTVKPFEDPFIDVKEVLKSSIIVCERWSDCCKILTKNFWKTFTPHKWSGDEFVPVTIVKFCQRLKEVYEIRSANEQYNNLVSGADKGEKVDQKSMFSAFVGIEVLQYNPFTDSVWQTAVAQYNREMLSYDQKISQILKNHLTKSQSNTQQVHFV
jgi:dynein heavy chain 2